MHLVLINQFYPPAKAPTGRLLQDLARGLVAAGHQVTVIASDAAYGVTGSAEKAAGGEGLRILRVGGRRRHGFGMLAKALDYLSFFKAAYARCKQLNPAPDALVCMTTPPFIGLVGYQLRRKRNIPYLLWCMDLYPEALSAHGLLRPGFLLNPLAKGISRMERRNASSVVSLGPDMSGLLAKNGCSGVCEIPVWSDIKTSPESLSRARALRRERGWGDEECIVMYSGNMGRAHRVSEAAALARQVRKTSRPVRVVFCGDGPARAGWERDHGDVIEFMTPYAGDDLAAHLLSADVHLVTQEPVWTGVVVPSKFQAACAVGRPVIFAGPEHASVARWIEEHDCGWVIAPDNQQAVYHVAELLADRDELQAKGEHAAALSRTLFDAAENRQKIIALLEQMANT